MTRASFSRFATALTLTLGAAVVAAACGTDASDVAATTDAPLAADGGAGAATASASDDQSSRAPRPAPARETTPARPVFREVTIPSGTTLPLSLTSAVASDTSAVEDAVSATLSRSLIVDGREVLPAGSNVSGHVTDVDNSGRVKGRAMIAFRFTSVRTGSDEYDVQSAAVTHVAPATKGEDATKIGIGAGAGAIIGGLIGGGDGAAKGAAIGGGAGTGVVLATRGQEMRLAPGADVSTQLTAPLTIRVRN